MFAKTFSPHVFRCLCGFRAAAGDESIAFTRWRTPIRKFHAHNYSEGIGADEDGGQARCVER